MTRPSRPPLLMQRLRWTMFRNALRTLVGRSVVRPSPSSSSRCSSGGCVFFGSLEGFRFLDKDVHVPLHGEIVGILLDLMFFTLGVLLLFSGGLILYGSLFTAPETAFLLGTPLDDDRVFAHKFQGATAISGWAFLLLGGPILIAYGVACESAVVFLRPIAALFYRFRPAAGFAECPGGPADRQPVAAAAQAGADRLRRRRGRAGRLVGRTRSLALTPAATATARTALHQVLRPLHLLRRAC